MPRVLASSVRKVEVKTFLWHFSVIEGDGFRTLKEGQTVRYEFERGPKGLQATRVTD